MASGKLWHTARKVCSLLKAIDKLAVYDDESEESVFEFVKSTVGESVEFNPPLTLPFAVIRTSLATPIALIIVPVSLVTTKLNEPNRVKIALVFQSGDRAEYTTTTIHLLASLLTWWNTSGLSRADKLASVVETMRSIDIPFTIKQEVYNAIERFVPRNYCVYVGYNRGVCVNGWDGEVYLNVTEKPVSIPPWRFYSSALADSIVENMSVVLPRINEYVDNLVKVVLFGKGLGGVSKWG